MGCGVAEQVLGKILSGYIFQHKPYLACFWFFITLLANVLPKHGNSPRLGSSRTLLEHMKNIFWGVTKFSWWRIIKFLYF